MKAYELMKFVAENPEKYEGKKFKVIYGEVIKRTGNPSESKVITFNENRRFVTDWNATVFFTQDTELEDIKPDPVSFMEAMNSQRLIKPEGYEEYRALSYWVCEFPRMSTKRFLDIINGAWYIQEF